MTWRKAVLAAGTILFVSTTPGWAGFSPYDDDYPGSYDPYDYQADSHDPHWLMDESSGCWAYDSNAGPMNSIAWSGDCRNGRAEGDGTLTFFERGRQIERLTGSFADGMLQDGHVRIAWSDGSSYDGDEVHGQFNGNGVLIAADGTRYDGRWQDDNFVGPVNRNPYLTGNADTNSDHAPDVADNRRAPDESDQTAQQAHPAVHWPFLDGTQSKLAAADGSVLSFSVEAGGVLKRSIVHADGSVADTTLTPDSDNSGSVRNQHGTVVASYRLDNDALDITYGNGRTETIAANGAGGLTVTTTPPGGLSIKSDWYPENGLTTTAKNDAGPATSGAASSPRGPAPPPPAPSSKLQVASLAPQHAAPSVHADGTREVEPEKHTAATHNIVHEARLVDTPFHPSLRPAAPVEVAENLPHPDLKPARAPEIVAENLPHPDVKPALPPEQVQVAENLRPEQKPTLRLSRKHDRHHIHNAVASAAPAPQPVEMHSEVLPPPPEVHTVAIPDLHIQAPAAAPVLRTPVPAAAAAHAAPATPVPVHLAAAGAAPPAQPPATPVHIATLHSIGAPEPALRKSASDCITVESNGTHWGFRNNCVTDIQFAYCVKNGADRLIACGDSAVPGSVAAHGFTSLIADLSMKDPSASHAFRWVACIGGAGEVVPRLDQSDPPMGRCLHTSDLPSGVERADAAKRK